MALFGSHRGRRLFDHDLGHPDHDHALTAKHLVVGVKSHRPLSELVHLVHAEDYQSLKILLMADTCNQKIECPTLTACTSRFYFAT